MRELLLILFNERYYSGKMLTYPNIDPVILRLGPLELRWYGLMYVIGFILAYLIIRKESVRKKLNFSEDDVYDFVFYLVMGVILGGRIGYILFYNLPWYLENPLQMLMINKGGMSFHGGFIGTIVAAFIYCKKHKKNFYDLADMGALAAPLGLGFGRIGNFINSELYGRITEQNFPLGVIFPNAGPEPRHPSQLYESLFEGFLMFAIMFILSRKTERKGIIFWSFIMFYGLFRFFIEYTREPDMQLGFVLGQMSMGQLLCLPMFISGLIMIIYINFSAKNLKNQSLNENEE